MLSELSVNKLCLTALVALVLVCATIGAAVVLSRPAAPAEAQRRQDVVGELQKLDRHTVEAVKECENCQLRISTLEQENGELRARVEKLEQKR